ncbi:hypothetical protein TNCT_88321 [Trichonephila clavata]|uniref:Uncharacterized protein n=1 Tax=Trichonephila clavata TaxID=2740835 RepID=A0A8X6K556_TRICU|nr:hypothetical protein TNCT_88321 [Trichonephila clavata]
MTYTSDDYLYEWFTVMWLETITNCLSCPEKYEQFLAERQKLDLSKHPNSITEPCTIIEEINPNSDLCIEPDSTTESHQEFRPVPESTSELLNTEPDVTTNPNTITKFEEINIGSSDYLTADDLVKEFDCNETKNLWKYIEPSILIEGLPI